VFVVWAVAEANIRPPTAKIRSALVILFFILL
jgi:hypothetical protein